MSYQQFACICSLSYLCCLSCRRMLILNSISHFILCICRLMIQNIHARNNFMKFWKIRCIRAISVRPWRRSFVPSFGNFSLTMLSSISFPTTIIISRRHISPIRIPTLKRMLPSMRRSTACVTAPPLRCLSVGM